METAFRVVRLWEDLANFCWWARLNNGLELMMSIDELAATPAYAISGYNRGEVYLEAVNPIERAEVALGLR